MKHEIAAFFRGLGGMTSGFLILLSIPVIGSCLGFSNPLAGNAFLELILILGGPLFLLLTLSALVLTFRWPVTRRIKLAVGALNLLGVLCSVVVTWWDVHFWRLGGLNLQ